ncbi:MAG: Bax inhibitor-1 family protein [Erysipelotrichaceae bacterium]|jgi:FtsH-binding integral membrane protein|nr:Bax inhibitor-1 family protein [Erysipelotrichaceae bacterium]
MAFYKNDNSNTNNPYVDNSIPIVSSKNLALAKVFGVMFLGILLTALIAVGFGLLFNSMITYENGVVVGIDDSLGALIMIGLIVSIIVMFISSSVISWKAFKTNSNRFTLIIPYILYIVSFGFLVSLITFACPIEVIYITFGVTLAIYGLLAGLGILLKNTNLNPFIYIAGALALGLMILMFLNIFLVPFLALEAYAGLFWIISFGIFALILITTLVDVWQINKILTAIPATTDVTLYCAFRLYTDFVNLFIRILWFVLMIVAKSRR